MNRYSNVVNLSKFGKRKVIPDIEPSSTIQLNNIRVSNINGVSVEETEQLNTRQSVEIDTSKQDIIMLRNKVLLLEGYVYDLQKVISKLTDINF